MRHSPQGECGLKSPGGTENLGFDRHSPQGECGLKLDTIAWALGGDRSLPARGVWIEIRVRILARVPTSRHSPQGECGLKSY